MDSEQETGPVVGEQECVVPDSASVKTFKERIKRAVMMYLADCEDTDSIPSVFGFDGFTTYLEHTRDTVMSDPSFLTRPLYKEDEFKL